MRLQSLQLSNIRSYRSLSLEFPEGIVLFQGDIGSGKSTILMAIEFALFGLGSLKADALLAKGAQRGEVLLKFEADDVQYEVGRELIKKRGASIQGSKNSFLAADGVRELLSPSELKPRVLSILKFREPPNVRATSRVYRYAIYTPQEETKSILYGGEREDTIRRAFGMEDYNIAADNAKNVIGNLKDRMIRIGDPTERLEIMNARLDKTRARMASTRDTLEKLESQKGHLDGQRSAADLELKEVRKKMNAYQILQNEHRHTVRHIEDKKRSLRMHQNNIANNRTRMESVRRQLDRYPDRAPPTEKTQNEIRQTIQLIHEKSSQIQRLGMSEDNCRREIDRLRAQLGKKGVEDMRNDMMQLQGSLASSLTQAESIRDRIAGARMSRGEHVNQVRSLRAALSRAQSLGDRCEYCNNVLEPRYVEKLAAERRAQLDKAGAGLAEIDDTIRTLEARRIGMRSSIDNIRRRIERARHLVEVAGELQRRRQEESDAARLKAKAQAEYDAIPYLEPGFGAVSGESPETYLRRLEAELVRHAMARNRRISLQNQMGTIQNGINQSEAMRAADMHEIDRKRRRLDEIVSDLASYGAISDILRECEEHLGSLDGQIRDVGMQVTRHRTELRGWAQDEARLVSDIKAARNDLDLYRKYEDHIEWLKKFFIPSLVGIETRALNLLRHEFNEFYQDWYKMLVDDPTKSSYIDERFGPVVEQGGYEQDVDSLSGGEKTGVALAFRLALNNTMREQAALPGTDIIILDEPTDGFSRDQMQKVSEILKSIDSKQIIMVSHERELEDYAEHRFRVTKTEGVSTINKITY